MPRSPRRGSKAKDIEIWRWPLPRDVRETLGQCATDPDKLLKNWPDNPGLLLQRYVAFPAYRKKPEGDGRTDKEFAEAELESTFGEWGWPKRLKGAKSKLWQQVFNRFKDLYANGSRVAAFFQHIRVRQSQLKEEIEKHGYKVECFPAEVVWRLIVGLGLPSPLEVGITLHHLYGFPYLPGSAVKGVTRHWKLLKIAEELGVPRLSAADMKWSKKKYGPTPWELLEQLLMSPVPREDDPEDRKKKLLKGISSRLKNLQDALRKAQGLGLLQGEPKVLSFDPKGDLEDLTRNHVEKFSRAFGSTEAKGEVIFFDAYPKELVVGDEPILELDVMTPHYGKYYTKDEPPADWLSPNPVLFPVVRRGTVFEVCLACKEEDLLKEVVGWAQEALGELGIGAKTRAGYGELRSSSAGATPSGGVEIPSYLALAVERWSSRDMGKLPQLVSQIAALPESEERRSLAEALREKLQRARYWGGEYCEKPWHKQLEDLLGD